MKPANDQSANHFDGVGAKSVQSIPSGLSIGLHAVPSYLLTLSGYNDTTTTERMKAHNPHSSTQQTLLVVVLGSGRHNYFQC